ncbi:MAG TPA: SH3 domain-containing protein [Candidatus Binatia bacterium]|jgi:hypothetical protein
MTRVRSLFFHAILSAIFLLLAPLTNAGDAPSGLTARATGVALYAQQDAESSRIATLEKGEALVPIVEAIGREVWYMVRTQQGIVGWVRGVDVIVSSQAREAFREKDSETSTWAARTVDGRIYNGTWSVAPNSTERSASGAWTLSDSSGTTVMRGTWSADKHNTGWNGVWRARVEGRDGEYSGSWSADLPHLPNTPFSELFTAAARDTLRGLWTGRSQSGSWSLRAKK